VRAINFNPRLKAPQEIGPSLEISVYQAGYDTQERLSAKVWVTNGQPDPLFQDKVLIDESRGRKAFAKAAIDACPQIDPVMLDKALIQLATGLPAAVGRGARERREVAAQQKSADIPEIVFEGDLAATTAEALRVLAGANDPPHIFTRGIELSRVIRNDEDRPLIQTLEPHALRGRLARVASWYLKAKNGPYPAPPPMDVVQDIRSLDDRGDGFPPLVGILEAPSLRPDGTIILQPGYDRPTHLFYDPDAGLTVPDIPLQPTEEQLHAAVATIADILDDFPFDSQASRANAHALLLTPVIRPLLGDSPAPMALLDAPKQGTGKSLLVRAISILATGQDAAAFTAPQDEAEWRKAITSMVIEGRPFVMIDNVDLRDFRSGDSIALQSAALSALLTTGRHKDRVLGASKMVELPSRATWVATGNNIQVGGDLIRRVYRVRLDAQVSRPWLRPSSGFRHPELLEHVQRHRGELLGALLTVCRAWVAKGRPDPTTPILGSYEAWSRTVGGILEVAGIEGFLDDLGDVYEQADAETPEWEGFLARWHELLGDGWMTVAALDAQIQGDIDPEGRTISGKVELRDALPSEISDAVGTKGFRKKLGQAMRKRVGTRHGDDQLFITKRTNGHAKVQEWRVASGAPSSELKL
jgi:hypothetical protein